MRRVIIGVVALVVLLGSIVNLQMAAHAETQPNDGFSLQVTPSPLIATIEPGKETTLELRIRNTNTSAEDLKMELRSFRIDKNTGEVRIENQQPTEVKDFVRFGQDTFRLEAGQWYTQRVKVNAPKDAGFSYSFAILISRKNPLPKLDGASRIEGSVAVFTLLNTNRPDATRSLSVASFSSKKRVYEYLPAEFETIVKNNGNTIVQPKGNIFIGRTGNESTPLAVTEVNPGGGYILPSSSRVLKTQWSDGFPGRAQNGSLVWDWSKLNQLRIGKYTAKVVLIYDDGKRDIPVYGEVSFWVLPWKILLGLTAILAVLLIGLYTIFRRPIRRVSSKAKQVRRRKQPAKAEDASKDI